MDYCSTSSNESERWYKKELPKYQWHKYYCWMTRCIRKGRSPVSCYKYLPMKRSVRWNMVIRSRRRHWDSCKDNMSHLGVTYMFSIPQHTTIFILCGMICYSGTSISANRLPSVFMHLNQFCHVSLHTLHIPDIPFIIHHAFLFQSTFCLVSLSRVFV